METSYIITFIGDDRPGLVERLSSVIENNDGSWHESRLSQLGGKFAGLVLVSLPTASGPALEAELKALSSSGISVRVTATGTGHAAPASRKVTMTVLGPDRLGIVLEISRALAEHQVNVVEMDSEVNSAAMSGEMMFHARIDAQVPAELSLDELSDTLDAIANVMTLDIDLEHS